MQLAVQLDFFQTSEQAEIYALRQEIEKQRIALDKQRKCLFAKNGSLTRDLVELKNDVEIIKRNICKS